MAPPRKTQARRYDRRVGPGIDRPAPQRKAVKVEMPPPGVNWAPAARAWYVSLNDSPQSDYYSASDWAVAQIAAQQLSLLLTRDKPSAQGLVAVYQMMKDLGSLVVDRTAAGMTDTEAGTDAPPLTVDELLNKIGVAE